MAMEVADKDTRAFKKTDTSVHKLGGGYFQKQKSPTPRQSCYRCDRSDYAPTECKFEDAQCRMCGKTGHIATACHSTPAKAPHKKQKHKSNTHHVQNDQQSDDDRSSSDEDYRLHKLGKRSPDPITVALQFNGKKLDM